MSASLSARRERDMEKARANGARRVDQLNLAMAERRQIESSQDETLHHTHDGRQDEIEQTRVRTSTQQPSITHSTMDRPSYATPHYERTLRREELPYSHRPNMPTTASSSSSSSSHRNRPSSAAYTQSSLSESHPESGLSSSSSSSSSSRSSAHSRAYMSELHLRSQYAPQSISPSSSASLSLLHSDSALAPRPFPGRSRYDFQAVLAARQQARDREVAEQLAEQEREEREQHAQSMQVAQEALKIFKVTSEWKRLWRDRTHTRECGICLDDFKLGQSIQQLPCHHTFHAESCLQPWLERQSTCPCCRYDLRQQCQALQVRQQTNEEEEFRL